MSINKTIIPCLLTFQLLAAQTPQQLKSWMPAISGWTVTAPEVFNPDNLYDRINGAAPLFLANNFKEMTTVDYKKGDEYITVQAYRHGTPQDAFGMYSAERSSEMDFLTGISAEAQGDAENLFFFAGSIYVKIASHADGDAGALLQAIAKGLAAQIDPQSKYPPMFDLFPAEGKEQHSESYVNSSFLGHDFLQQVYRVDYTLDNRPFAIFIVDCKSVDNAKAILNSYFTFSKQPLTYQQGNLLIKDRYNGDIPVRWKDAYIIGVYSDGAPIDRSAELINGIAAKL